MGSWVKMLFSRFTKTVNQTQFTLSLDRSIKTKENKKCNILWYFHKTKSILRKLKYYQKENFGLLFFDIYF